MHTILSSVEMHGHKGKGCHDLADYILNCLNCLPHVARGDREVFWSETKRNMGNEIMTSVLRE